MIHIRKDDDGAPNSERRMLCGIGPELPEGDMFFFESEVGSHYRVDCLGCNPAGPRKLGTPLSELSGRPGPKDDIGHPDHARYAEFCRIARSWGYD